MALFLLSGFGDVFYAAILLVNAVAVLSEDRFLARSKYYPGDGQEVFFFSYLWFYFFSELPLLTLS